LKEQGGTTKPRGGVAEYSTDVGRWREATSWSSCFRGAAALSRSRLDFSARDAHVAGAACIASRSAAHLADQHAPVWGPPPRRAAQLTPGRALARARQAQHAEEPPECCNGSRSSRPSMSHSRGLLRASSAACAARALPGGAAAVSAAGGRRPRSLPAGSPPVGCRQLVHPE
jgi:hypothetical protein